jgi:RNA polymerase sigma-70 factor (sigma-E family)
MLVAATALGETDHAAERHAFGEFFAAHHRELGRLAYLLSGDRDAADDITAEAFAEAWRRWERVSRADSPIAYVRRIVVNLAADRVRALMRERRGRRLLGATWSEPAADPDVAALADIRRALTKLPARKRACVVLRHYYGLSEQETAQTLGISVGTVKSQTSRGVAELAALLGIGPGRAKAGRPERAGPADAPERTEGRRRRGDE